MSSDEPSQRQLRVGEAVRHALATVLQRGDLRDPALTGVSITVSEVRVTPDLRQATCFVTPLGATSGQGADEAKVVEALSRASAFLRGQLAREVRLKYMPALQFRADRSFDEAARIDEVLKRPEVARDLAAEDAPEEPAESDDPAAPEAPGTPETPDDPGTRAAAAPPDWPDMFESSPDPDAAPDAETAPETDRREGTRDRHPSVPGPGDDAAG